MFINVLLLFIIFERAGICALIVKKRVIDGKETDLAAGFKTAE